MFELAKIGRQKPLIHVISNAVTLTDVVNAILASGGVAIGADAPEEAAEITRLADGLVLNIGTPSRAKREAMLTAGKTANAKGIPVVLDPVGAGASVFRRQILAELLQNVRFTCIRGNLSEMWTLAGIAEEAGVMDASGTGRQSGTGNAGRSECPDHSGTAPEERKDHKTAPALNSGTVLEDRSSRGVEDSAGALTGEKLAALERFSESLCTVLAVTGAEDFVICGTDVRRIHGGSPLQKRMTGSGCMLSGLTAGALAAEYMALRGGGSCITAEINPALKDTRDRPKQSPKPDAAAAGWVSEAAQTVETLIRAYDRAAEEAAERVRQQDAGMGTFHTALLDAISKWPVTEFED